MTSSAMGPWYAAKVVEKFKAAQEGRRADRGSRVRGREGERVGRDAEGEERDAGNSPLGGLGTYSPPCPPFARRARLSRSRKSPTQPAFRWPLPLPLPLTGTLAELRREFPLAAAVRPFASCGFTVVAALALLAALAGLSCRRAPHFVRSDAAAVVVAQRTRDTRGAPYLAEREPNNTSAEAQEVTWVGNPLAAAITGRIERADVGKSADVDMFRVVVPGQPMVASLDAGQAADWRLHAKRLSAVINPEAGLALALDLLDETARVVKTVAAGPGETVGLPNMAVLPGGTYYLRARAVSAPAKRSRGTPDAGAPAGSSYQMALLLLDFEGGDEREPNDRLETAGELSWQGGSALAAGLFGWRHDEDWYRLPLDVMGSGWVLNLELEGVEGVAAGLAVSDSAGRKVVAARGRKGERVTLHNLVLPRVVVDAGAAAAGGRWWYLVVSAESGFDREHRYVLRADAVLPEGGFETEPNDDAVHASSLGDGTTTGYLPEGDVDFFRYLAGEPRQLDIEIGPPSRVRVKVEVSRERDGKVLAEAAAAKTRQALRIQGLSCPAEPVLIRLSQGKHDGNSSEPYLLKVTSRPSQRDAGRPE